MDGVRWSYEYIRDFFKKEGCELLEKEYINAHKKLAYKCNCGNITSICFDSFRLGNRCRLCGNKKAGKKQRLSHKEVFAAFEVIGYKLLNQYETAQKPLHYICTCGAERTISWNNFQRGHRCKSCSIKKRSGPHHYEWKEDRKKHKEERKFRCMCNAMVRRCIKLIGSVKESKSELILGYSSKILKKHILGHPNFEKIKNDSWDVDHIFPVMAFIRHGIFDIKLINCLENLQPLDHKENISKSDKYDINEFRSWLEQKGIQWTL